MVALAVQLYLHCKIQSVPEMIVFPDKHHKPEPDIGLNPASKFWSGSRIRVRAGCVDRYQELPHRVQSEETKAL